MEKVTSSTPDTVEGGDPNADLRGKPADPYLCREFWLECLQHRHRENSDAVTSGIAKSKQAISVAKTQNYYLNRRTFGMPKGYERIKWNNRTGQ